MNTPHTYDPQKIPPNPPKSPQTPQNLKKSNFSALGLDRDLWFSRGLHAQSSPRSEYYPYLCIPPKIPLPSYQLILHKLIVKQLSDPNCAPCLITLYGGVSSSDVSPSSEVDSRLGGSWVSVRSSQLSSRVTNGFVFRRGWFARPRT